MREWVVARTSRLSLEVRECAVRMVLEHASENVLRWAAAISIAERIGCGAERLRRWVRQVERNAGKRTGLTNEEHVRLGKLERENLELRRANEILRLASPCLAKRKCDHRAE